MRKILSLILAAAIVLAALTAIPASAEETAETAGECAAKILTEAETGTVLFAENEHKKLPIASVTKIMVLLIAAEEIAAGKLSFSETAVASAYASGMDGSVIWLESGEEMTVGELIKSIVIASANDACVCLAERISGNEEDFVKRMNSRAKALGMTDTHFANCVGYDDEKHYSSARDVALMTAELMKYDYYSEYFLTRLTYAREGTERETQLLNTNKLLKLDGIEGGKTGTTDNAGYCFSVAVKRGGMRLIAVVLGAKDEDYRFSAAKELIESGFSGYELFSPEIPAEMLSDIAVNDGVEKFVSVRAVNTGKCVIQKGTAGSVEYRAELLPTADAPVSEGDVLGKAYAELNGGVIFETEITAGRSVEKLTFTKSFTLILGYLFR